MSRPVEDRLNKNKFKKLQQGMTLIEMLLVLAILGILLGVAAFTKPWSFEGRRFAEDVRRTLQVVKSEAAKRNRSVWVEVQDDAIVAFTGTPTAGCGVTPEEEIARVDATAYHGGFTLSTDYPGGLVRWNPQGFPRDCYGNPSGGEIDLQGADRTLCVSVGGTLQVVREGNCP